MTFIVYFAADIFYRICHGIRVVDCLKGYSGAIFDVLLLQIAGICKNPQFNAWWYLSALAFALPLAVMLFRKAIAGEGGYRYIVIALPLITYGWFSLTLNGLDWETLIIVIRSGFFRGLAGLCVGANIFCLSQQLAQKEKNSITKIGLTLIESLVYVGALWIAWKAYDIVNATFIIIALLFIGLTISFSDQSYTTKLNIKAFSILGEIATPLYICHYSIGRLVGMYLSGYDVNTHDRYLIYILTSMGFAGIMLIAYKLIKKKGRK